MTNTGQKGFFIADWEVSPAEGALRRDLEVVRLEPKAMEVLVYLASRPGEVVTREALERDVWRGALIGYEAVTNTVIKLRKALNDDARQPRYIVTIPKKGYQLIAAITWADSPTAHASENSKGDRRVPANRSAPGLKPWMTVLVVLGMFVLVWLWSENSSTRHILPSILVLPFANLNDDSRQEYLADGMTEDIITDLSRMSNIRVIASNTAFKYKGKQVDTEAVGADLAVGYVLKGSVRQQGGELRVNAQLVDTTTGFNLWAERYDRKVSDLFAVQDEVTKNIVSALAVKLSNKEKQRIARKATDSLKAYDYFQEGQRLYKISTQEANLRANEMYRKAIELDPGYGRAFGAQAVVLVMDYRRGWTDSPMPTLDQALNLAKKAVVLDDSTPQTYWALGFVHLARKEFDQAEQAAVKSVDIAPNYADGYGLIALINAYLGRPERAIELNDKAIRLNPYYSYEYLNTYAIAYYTQGNYSQAIQMLEEAQARNPNHILIKLLLAASYVKAKRQSDAEWAIIELKTLSPNVHLTTVANNIPLARPEIMRGFLADLRTAGLPE